MCTAQSFIHPKCLPPLLQLQKLAVYEHFFKFKNGERTKSDFGWNLRDGKWHPLITDLPPAPTNVLKLFKFSCSGSCSKMCSCRKNGLECTLGFKNCKGLTCINSDKCYVNDKSMQNTEKFLIYSYTDNFSKVN